VVRGRLGARRVLDRYFWRPVAEHLQQGVALPPKSHSRSASTIYSMARTPVLRSFGAVMHVLRLRAIQLPGAEGLPWRPSDILLLARPDSTSQQQASFIVFFAYGQKPAETFKMLENGASAAASTPRATPAGC